MDKKIEIRSEEIQEILGKPPQWLVRWGVSIMFITVSILIIGTKYMTKNQKCLFCPENERLRVS